MYLPRHLLERHGAETTRLIALYYLDQAVRARPRLADPNDAEALHDFRVALRRVRTTLRAFRKPLAGAVSGSTRGSLKQLSDATRRSRDLEVHRAWALQTASDLTPRQQEGVFWLVDRMDRQKIKADRRLMREVRSRFKPLARRLKRGFTRFTVRVRLDRHGVDQSGAVVVGRVIERLAGVLEESLAGIRTAQDRKTIHRARIAAKRLRYVLEPVEVAVDAAGPLVARLKDLQDVLGDLHDTQVFEEELRRAGKAAARDYARRLARHLKRREPGEDPDQGLVADPRPGLLALSRRLRIRGTEAFRETEARWLHGAADDFFAAAADLARELMASAYGSREVERKYLLATLPPAAHMAPSVRIEQGWLPGQRIAERLRRVLGAGGDEERWRTIKAGRGIDRLEVEEAVAASLFEQLWPLTEGRRVQKRRHQVKDHDLTWEIDEFTDRDLVLAEVELSSPDEAVEPPEWLKPYVVREVTGEDAYVNLNLAR